MGYKVAPMVVLMVACGDSGTVKGRLSLVNGATPSGTAARVAPAPPGDGRWLLSPTTLSMNLVKIGLGSRTGGSSSQPADVSCAVTFDQAKPGLAQLAECPFTASPGTYDQLDLSFEPSITVLVDDAANGFYSTPAGIVVTPPSGGAQPYTYTVEAGADGTVRPLIDLPKQVTVADGDTVELSIVLNALQSVRVTVTGSTVAGGWTGGTSYKDPGRPDLVGAVGSLAKAKLYASPTLNTAGSYCAGGCTGMPPQGITSVTVYYSSPTDVNMVGMQLNGSPASCGNIFPAFINDPKGYVGLDAGGVLGWATGNDSNYTSYAGLFRMAQASAIGDTSALYCKTTTSDPAPAGGSFASGAPDIATTGTNLGSYVLVAE